MKREKRKEKREKRKAKLEERRKNEERDLARDLLSRSGMARRAGLVPIEDRTFAFGLALIRAYRAYPPRDDADRVIWHQLLKSGTSAGANSAESPGSQSRREWITRRHIALKEMRESQFWLRLLQASNPAKAPDQLAELIDESSQLVAILTATLNTARRNSKRDGPGSNYTAREPDYPPT